MGVCLSSTFNFKYNKLDSIADLLLVSIVDDDDRHIIHSDYTILPKNYGVKFYQCVWRFMRLFCGQRVYL